MVSKENVLQRINVELEEGWEAKLSPEGRIFYVNHKNQITSWLPPRDSWDSDIGLPYGWETGIDKNDKPYYINHVEKYTTREDPRHDPDYVEPPKPRDVELIRDPDKGFGFVAGSEKPVVVRFVTDGGPSVDKLLSGDQILKINGEDVRKAPREKVIELVRACKHSIILTVCQPYADNSSRRSALLTAAKKAKLKNNPSRVRFADSVMVNGAPVLTRSIQESYVPFMPNVLKVFLENGQTKSFKYDNKTTVKDVMDSLKEKLNLKCIQHFNVVLQNMKNNTAGKMTLLEEHETLAEIAARPGARHFRCLFRVTYVPRDAYDLLKEDAISFEYFYLQCCNDVVQERFASELKFDTALRLAALQMQQHAMSNNLSGKISIKTIEKNCGLEKFVPHSLLENMKGKELRKMLGQYMKMNQNLTAPGQKQLSALQAKLHYMKIVSELKTFGSRVFMVTLLDKKTEAMVLVGPKSGVSVVTNIKSYTLTQLTDFEHIEAIKVTKEGENMHRVDMKVKGQHEDISLGLLTEDAQNFVCMCEGYYHIFVDSDKRIVERTLGKYTSDPDVPPYASKHRVLAAPWTYPDDLVSEIIEPDSGEENGQVSEDEKLIDLAQPPPTYIENKDYLVDVKHDLSTTQQTANEASETISLVKPVENGHSEVASSNLPLLNGSIYEEEVTSFGVTTLAQKHEPDKDSSVSGSSDAIRKSFRTLLDVSSHSGSLYVTKHQDKPTEPSRTDEVPSDTDSGSGTDIERKPLLAPSATLVNGDSHASYDIESSDTDSWGTPNSSPAKTRLGKESSGFQSFGLHSPDFSGSSSDLQHIAESFGLHSPDEIPPDLCMSLTNPTQLNTKGIYLDPDIIDLTLYPPPMTPDDGKMIDFTDISNVSPPTFTSPPPHSSPFKSTSLSGSPVHSKIVPVKPALHGSPVNARQLLRSSNTMTPSLRHSGGDPSVVHSGMPHSKSQTVVDAAQFRPSHDALAESASVEHCPDFFDNDIDELIARFVVPPPPPSNSTAHGMEDDGESTRKLFQNLEDEFTALIIPPPPDSESPTEDDIRVVLPVHNDTVVNDHKDKDVSQIKTKKFRHKRSASVDINSLRLAKELVNGDHTGSLDSKQRGGGEQVIQRQFDPPNSLCRLQSDPGRPEQSGLPAESPATVSERLNSLLRSLPNFCSMAEVVKEPFVRTGSLRLKSASSSKDVVAGSSPSAAVPVDVVSGFCSLRARPSKRSSSFERFNTGDLNSDIVASNQKDIPRAQSFDSVQQSSDQSEMKEITHADSFASLKEKLREYRDLLLSRSNSVRRSRLGSPSSSNTEAQQNDGSLHRRNSFSDLLEKFRTRHSNDRKKSENFEKLKDMFSENGAQSGEGSKGDKKTFLMYNSLQVPRTTLRPSSQQSKSKKSGPLKALSSVFATEEKSATKGSYCLKENYTPKAEEKPKHRKKNRSKDDIAMLSKRDKVKANPYATIKMWRPITMTTSVSQDEDVYRNFSNFDSLREMSLVQASPPTRDRIQPVDGSNHIGLTSDLARHSHLEMSDTGSASVPPKSPSPALSGSPSKLGDYRTINGSIPSADPVAPPRTRKGSVVDSSYSVVSDTVVDSVKYVLSKKYGIDDFESASKDVERLLDDIKITMESLRTSRIDRKLRQFEICKEELMNQTKLFVNDAKMLVSSATQTRDELAANLHRGIHSLAKIFLHSQAVMLMMESQHLGQHLGAEVIKVSNAFRSTVSASNAAVGKPLHDPHMKYLMRQATNLASLLSMLIKTLKTLESK
ncbi:uncharacterized protein LOC121374154 isoform X2 [Gigantopelta aegis]|uniref:uncharacterized protein LOC121374154 isoform X2 n=1 Tax=Gigantopelta aegis TaxID=1735272 RepID=UPI001B889586|nr:uncharacterized protein LOC121374154 isoform X2 [Gigantopelta aegis]